MTLFASKPWDFKGRRTERNTPIGRKCDETCTHRAPAASQALCSVCHEIFGGITAFDKHRENGWCINPVDLGFEIGSRGTWGEPMSQEKLNRLRSFGPQRNEDPDGDD